MQEGAWYIHHPVTSVTLGKDHLKSTASSSPSAGTHTPTGDSTITSAAIDDVWAIPSIYIASFTLQFNFSLIYTCMLIIRGRTSNQLKQVKSYLTSYIVASSLQRLHSTV